MKYIPLTGRILFALIFISSGFNHLANTVQTAAYAASAHVPMATTAVILSGIIALLGALSILLGYKAKIGGWLLVLFLVPVTLMMHNFWAITDPSQQMMKMMQMSMFMKNLGLIGGALMFAYFGAGPLSLDSRSQKSKLRNLNKNNNQHADTTVRIAS